MLFRSKAPLRLGLAGGGTDVSPYSDEYGGFVLNATIDLYAYCTLEVTENNRVSFCAADRDEYFECDSKEFYQLDGVLSLHKGVYNRIVKDYNHNKPLSLIITTYSDAPAGSGLGSSSTMVVAMLKAYQEFLGLPLGDYDMAHLAYEIERVDVGLTGGKQDQYAATFGGFNFIEFYANDRVIVNPLRVKRWIINELENSMVLYYSGASRESSKIIDEQIRNTQVKNETAINAMHMLKNDALIMKEALLKGNVQEFGRYLGKSWEAKKQMAKSISNSQIDQIYDLALQSGAYAGKVSGAGGGGYMMFMVDPVKRLNLIRALNNTNGLVMKVHFYDYGTQAWRINNTLEFGGILD